MATALELRRPSGAFAWRTRNWRQRILLLPPSVQACLPLLHFVEARRRLFYFPAPHWCLAGREPSELCARIAPLNPPQAPPRRGTALLGQFPSWERSWVGAL